MQTLTLFVSSPGDVRDERQAVGRIVERLQARYWNFLRLEPVLWEKEPLRATAHFNEELIRPSDCDLFVCVLWSRLGSPLPSQFNRKDGTRFDSGTEWELEEATEAFEERAAKKDKKDGKPKPDILVYRRMSERPAGSDPAQVKKLDAFCERFFFNKDKTIRRAFSPYETVDEFMALFEQHLEKLLLRHIQLHRGLAEDAVRPLPLEGSPFKGLGTFDYEDAPLFFGRNRPIVEALNQLKANHAAGHAFLLIYGGSGYGKSSLMRAGLAPRLTADGYLPEVGAWCGTTVLPVEGDAPPLETLARAITGALPELAKIRDTSRNVIAPASPKGKKGRKSKTGPKPEPVWDSARLARTLGNPEELVFGIAAIVAALDRLSAAKPANFLLLVDQLEEIFTARDITAEMRDAFFHVLAALAMSRRIWVVATMRSEFFPRVPEHRDLFQLVRHGGGYILSPPELPELQQIIRYPALAAGLQFERHRESGRDLSEQIYQDASHANDALPLLEFTLEELYQRRSENVLTWAAYEELGGLAGAIARRAQETYDALPSDSRRDAARQIFGELVTLDAANEGPATRRRAKRAGLEAAHPGATAFLTAFVDAKLLVTGSEDDAATVTLAHEALITHWPVLKQWIEDHRDLLLARRRLEDATRLWNDGKRSTRFYLTEGRLAEAERVGSSGVFRLSADESELVRLSRIRARRKLRLFQGATVVFAGLAAAAGVLGVIAKKKQGEAVVAQGKALESAAETRRSLAAADFDAGAARIENGAPDEALPYLLAALEGDPANLDAQALLLETLRRTAWNFPEFEIRHPLPVRMLSFGADRDTLFAATDSSSSGEGFNTTLRWDLQKPAITSMLAPHWGEITLTLSVAPGGKRLIVQRAYKYLEDAFLIDAESMRVIARLSVTSTHKIPATCFAWSPDGLLLAYPAKSDPDAPVRSSFTWRIIDSTRGQTVRESDLIPEDSAEPLAAQLDTTRLRTIAKDGSVFEMPLQPATPLRRGKFDEPLAFAVFSPDGTRLLAATPSEDKDMPQRQILEIGDDTSTGGLTVSEADRAEPHPWARTTELAGRFPWARWESPFWQRLIDAPGDDSPPPLRPRGSRLESTDLDGTRRDPRAPVHADSQIESVAVSGNRVAIGSTSGLLAIHEILPRPGHALPGPDALGPSEDDSEEALPDEGWRTVRPHPTADLQTRGGSWRLRQKTGGAVAMLEPHSNWMYVEGADVSTDGKWVVLAGCSSGTGGYSSAGIVASDPVTGAILSDLERVNEIRSVLFLGDRHRVAAMGSTEVIIADLDDAGFHRVAAIPVVDALSIHHLAARGLLAIANVAEVSLYDTRDFSRVATLPVGISDRWDNWDKDSHEWAEDSARGWLAYRRRDKLDVWSLRSGRPLVSGLTLPSSETAMTFAEKDGSTGLSFGGRFQTFLPLARIQGLDAGQTAALRAFSESVAGTAFAGDSRSLAFLSADDRRGRAKTVARPVLESLLPGAGVLLEKIDALAPRTASPEVWVPVWDRLATGAGNDRLLVRRAASLGSGHPWFQEYVRGLIARSDRNFYTLRRGETPADYEPDPQTPLPWDPEVAHLHRLAGDPAARGRLKDDAWLCLRTDAVVAGKELAGADTREDFPELDFAALAKLEPAALDALRTSLKDEDPRDWRVVFLAELPKRAAALERLDAHVAATLADVEKDPSVRHAILHAEALVLRGRADDAAKFLDGKIPQDAPLTLEQAHFLIASRLAASCRPAIDRALDALASPRLWSAWLELPGEPALTLRVERTMNAVDGRGLAAIAGLHAALRAEDAAAIAAALKLAKDLPGPVRDYATACALWAEGKKSGVYAIWPDEFPDFLALEESGDWGGWEAVMAWQEIEAFIEQLEQQLAVLKAKPDATVDDLRALATLLLDPATTTTFGSRRVRDAMVACSLVLANDQVSGPLVEKMVDRARLGGASPTDCLRIEARMFMADGEFTAAYSRWLQLIDTQDAEILASDYLEAAACVFEDMQDAAAIELALRGKDKFPADPTYAYDGAWLLLTAGHPEEAGILLEHGFKIPFTGDQKQTAIAMLLCAAEQTGRADRADQAFQELLEISPEWGDEEAIKSLEWPEALMENLLSVAERNR